MTLSQTSSGGCSALGHGEAGQGALLSLRFQAKLLQREMAVSDRCKRTRTPSTALGNILVTSISKTNCPNYFKSEVTLKNKSEEFKYFIGNVLVCFKSLLLLLSDCLVLVSLQGFGVFRHKSSQIQLWN
jgi:hypothetical protein